MSQNSAEQLNNWPMLAGLVLLIYDYLLTLPTEIHIVWPWPKPWFMLVRYLALSTNIIMVALTFGTGGSQDIITYAILTLRVYALFNRNRVILGVLSLGGVGSFAIGIWLGGTTDTAASLPGSYCMLYHVSAIRFAGAWEAGLFRDLLIFAFTLLRGLMHWWHENYHSPFVNCFVLDGSVYFCVIAVVDVANILVYYFGDPFFAGNLAWLASALSAVFMARLILNMREVANTDGITVGDVASEDTNTVEWNDIDGIPMEYIRGHVRNGASWGYGNDLE
ncbi:hypothetical protein B0H14DRAFT_3436126 [Mycena olivaceomarginata]|nr:hypothetical protein B0H14DRAFT_3436126 [Mycena olivaceomarginata]